MGFRYGPSQDSIFIAAPVLPASRRYSRVGGDWLVGIMHVVEGSAWRLGDERKGAKSYSTGSCENKDNL